MLVAVSSATELVLGVYGLVIRTLQSNGLHAGYVHSAGFDLLLANVWLYSMVLLVPAGAVGAVELWARGRSGHARAVALICLLGISMCGEVWADQRAQPPTRISSPAWLHDGRAWFALTCVLAIAVFSLTVRLLRPPGAHGREEPSVAAT